MNYFCTIDEAVSEITKGKMLILVDSPFRENEGDLFIPADKVNPEVITTMIRFGGGLICCAITANQAARLHLPLMVDPQENNEKTHVNFSVSVNSKKGITTGVSAFDRSLTIKVLANPNSYAEDLVRPGHVLGLIAKPGGVLERQGHTEAAVDLARLANSNPAGILCEILKDDGRISKLSDLIKLSKRLGIKIAAIDDLIKYLMVNPLPMLPKNSEVVKSAVSRLPTDYGMFQIVVYKSIADNREHAVLLMGSVKQSLLTRIHSQCLTGDTFFSQSCDCGQQLSSSMRLISKKKGGVILYLNQEGRGIGLINKIKAYALQDKGYDTVEANHALGFPADARQYKIAADILKDLGIYQINLLTNNPDKEKQLISEGIDVVKISPLEIKPNKINHRYLTTKKRRLGHKLTKI